MVLKSLVLLSLLALGFFSGHRLTSTYVFTSKKELRRWDQLSREEILELLSRKP